MSTKVLMPKFNMSMTVGLVAKWFKNEGEMVSMGEPLCEIEGDKATMELESPADGVLLKILVPQGQEAQILTGIGFIGKPGEDIRAEIEKEYASSIKQESKNMVTPEKATNTSIEGETKRIIASPVAKRLAQELNVDLNSLVGTGPEGMISRDDVLAAKENQKKPMADKVGVKRSIKLTGIKKITAERMHLSASEAPQFALTISVNMSAAERIREGIKNKAHITITDILIFSVAKTLSNHEMLNSSIQNDEIDIFQDINIGFAAGTDKGLMVPVLKQAESKNLAEISALREELSGHAKSGRLLPEDISGGTFTISNLGMFGIESFSPIIFPGQACILGVGNINLTPTSNDSGNVIIAPLMKMTLVSDHRIIDGVDGSNFLKDLKFMIENLENYL